MTEQLQRWVYRWPWTRACMLLYCIGCSCVGLLGLSNPAPSLENQLGPNAVVLYSWILLVAGVMGAVGIFRSLRATVIAVYAIAAATFFHGAAVVAGGGVQTGLRLLVAPLMMVPLAWTWYQWLVVIKHARQEGCMFRGWERWNKSPK